MDPLTIILVVVVVLVLAGALGGPRASWWPRDSNALGYGLYVVVVIVLIVLLLRWLRAA